MEIVEAHDRQCGDEPEQVELMNSLLYHFGIH